MVFKENIFTLLVQILRVKNYLILNYKIEAPVINDSKPFELLGTREDIITKTNEEILNVNV